jgi:hypothetical protein
MKTTDLPGDRCLDCNTPLECATDALTEATPKPGDFSICFRCGHVMAFDPGLKLRALTGAEIVELAGDQRLVKLQTARGEVMKLREIVERSGRK